MIVQRFSFEAFGVPLAVEVRGAATPALVAAVRAILPPGRVPLVASAPVVVTVSITAHRDRYEVRGADLGSATFAVAPEAVHAVDAAIRAFVSLAAPRHVFIHAGVVRGAEGAIVVPGRSFSGKTTLIGALVRAGATYLSDEYAVLDSSGWVHPYPRPLSFRATDGRRTDVPPGLLGRVAADEPVPVALVVTTTYRPSARWHGSLRTPAECALALVDNAVAARVRPADVLAAATAVARTTPHLSGDRGDADELAHHLLEAVGGRGAR